MNALINLSQLGLQVPKGYFISEDKLTSLWTEAIPELVGLETTVHPNLPTYETIVQRLDQLSFPAELNAEISDLISLNKTYIVRSSGLMEDQASTSFAGQYDTIANCTTTDDIIAALKQCIASLFKPAAITYWQTHQLDVQNLRMSVIIQEQVSAVSSGISFTLNPLTNNDRQLTLEVVKGAGEQLVSGLVTPEQLTIDWFSTIGPTNCSKILSSGQLKQLQEQLLLIATFYGYPVDVEFCFSKDSLFFLQARPITTIRRKINEGNWTTTNFRDGGVAAQPCPGLMWSLYRESWQTTLEKFLIQNKLYDSTNINQLSINHFARPYWNIGVVKEAMSRIPGYIEREFDDELGVYKNYQGDGYKSKLTVKTLSHLLTVATRITKTTQQQRQTAAQQHKQLLETYQSIDKKIQSLSSATDQHKIEALWETIINDAYLQSEQTYFWQVYVNTVQLSMKKTALLKKLPLDTFFQLISKLGAVSHIQPLRDLYEIVDIILANDKFKQEWMTNSPVDINTLLTKQPHRLDAQRIKAFQAIFGYHSNRELNLLVPSYSEDQQLVVDLLKDYVDHPEKLKAAQHSFSQIQTEEQMGKLIEPYVSKWQRTKVMKDIKMLRDLLWWREEFKDVSTRFYHLIRQITLKLGERYSQLGYIDQTEDLFYLEKETIHSFITNQLSQESLQKSVQDNRMYCQAYRHFVPPGDLMETSISPEMENLLVDTPSSLSGIGANDGIVSGKVRILLDPKDIHQLQAGEILVTRFTDTGWSHAFGSIEGLITETGGVLCHASIVAREFGIPTIVCATHATENLKTGMTVTMNGTTGDITIQKGGC
ncbi:MAG: PEP/pyruvate-binding domain-containing protein [Carnobacterium sp.]|uniref:PEP/pyruvate-binding domain-containing protein n=1 Tax=Carnobacterium sp. TaxID=48221 RepID=UPI003314CE6A